jgi:hypothetical protein
MTSHRKRVVDLDPGELVIINKHTMRVTRISKESCRHWVKASGEGVSAMWFFSDDDEISVPERNLN